MIILVNETKQLLTFNYLDDNDVWHAKSIEVYFDGKEIKVEKWHDYKHMEGEVEVA